MSLDLILGAILAIALLGWMLNVMALGSPKSAILSAVIFNALIILFLIPLALKGVKWRAGPAGQLLARNLAIYGMGGLAAPGSASV